MAVGPRYSAALAFASELHGSQLRKGTAVPYIAHLLSVSALVLEAGGDEDAAIAALLHDAVEDQGGRPMLDRIRARFGDGVADIVAACTDAEVTPKPPWRQRKEAYLASIPHKPAPALLVSIADKVHNAGAILRDYTQLGEAVWARFAGGREGTLWYYRSLSDAFRDRAPQPLWELLEERVAALEARARTAG
ncbi:MAG: HD domain-containing protein [Gemmatimonadetes bacterium]|nr:HD domain-containing protein [Gemmatimonadota bacterium]MBK7351289.1 HD domain-containing protein [Gemmatimonadota bacterium]MBK7786450.1 HD domain-containing protein [Gemmatimonadota bacterium]MBK9065835.1 HD domain-containing protein [Gemmatimonadota bacterium]MBP9199935.1 HD domain-containing protein [Gemmatimonadales bacterium]